MTPLRICAVSIPAAQDILDPDETVLELSEVSTLLGVSVTRVHQHLRDGHLMAVRRNGSLVVPKVFFDEKGTVVKPLPGLLVSSSRTAVSTSPRRCAGCSPRIRR